MMIWLRSVLFALVFYTGTTVAVLTAFLLVPFGNAAVRAQAQRWASMHRWATRHILGIRVRFEGTLPEGTVLYAAKHQSMFETLELLKALRGPATVLKRELADIPLFGAIARRQGVIPVDRAGSAKALRRMMRAAADAREAGRSVLIFPEGTRVPPGEKPPLQPGFAGLYKQLRLPVVPIALDSGIVWPRHSFRKWPGVITIRLGDPIPPGPPRDEVERRVHAAINALEA